MDREAIKKDIRQWLNIGNVQTIHTFSWLINYIIEQVRKAKVEVAEEIKNNILSAYCGLPDNDANKCKQYKIDDCVKCVCDRVIQSNSGEVE